MRIVLDTKVVVSGLLNPNGAPASILNLVVNGQLQVLYDVRIVHEYTDVLHRRRFGFDSDSVAALVECIETEGEFVPCEPASVEFSDEDDRPLFEVALTGEADFLVTGNRDHFPAYHWSKLRESFLTRTSIEVRRDITRPPPWARFDRSPGLSYRR